jgi:hypothetical protein
MTGKEAYRLFKEPTVRSMNPQQIEGVQDGYTVDTPEHPQTLHLTLRVYRESDNYTVTMGVHTSSKELREARERMYAQTESPVRVISAPAEEATPADASAVDAYVTATPVQPATIAFIFALHRRKSKRLLKAMAQRLAQEMEEQWEADEAQRETLNAALDAAM